MAELKVHDYEFEETYEQEFYALSDPPIVQLPR